MRGSLTKIGTGKRVNTFVHIPKSLQVLVDDVEGDVSFTGSSRRGDDVVAALQSWLGQLHLILAQLLYPVRRRGETRIGPAVQNLCVSPVTLKRL